MLDWNEISRLVDEGYIYEKEWDNLRLYNYAPKTQYEEYWTPDTLACRGLIADARSKQIVARPFDKIFNYGERDRYYPPEDATIECVTEKMDGSLGIGFTKDGRWHIATRGSFDSEQANWATSYLWNNHMDTSINPDYTPLFEILYPENRIVVDYGNREDLVLLAMRHRFTGEYLPINKVRLFADINGFSTPRVYPFNTPEEIQKAQKEIGPNQEGWVADFSDGSKWKFKGDEYVKVHRFINQVSFKNTLEAVKEDRIDEMMDAIPDEFHCEIEEHLDEISTTVKNVLRDVAKHWHDAPLWSRKEYALWVQYRCPDLAPYMFTMLDYGMDEVEKLVYKLEFKNR